MGMAVDMLLAIAVISFASGTIPEFQLGIGNIRSAADDAFVSVGDLLLLRKGDHFRSGVCFFVLCFSLFPPGQGKYIDDIPAGKQEEITQRH